MSPGLSALKRADCKSPEKESLRLRLPLSSPFPSLHVKGPPLLRILVRGQKDGKSERRQTGEGEAVPLQKGSFQNPFACSDFGPFCRKGGPKLEAWRGGSDTLTVEGGRSQECFRFWPPPPTSSSWGFVRLPTGSLTTSAPSCSLINRLLELGFCLRRLRRGLLAARLLWQADSWLAHVTPISRKGKYRYQISSRWLA